MSRYNGELYRDIAFWCAVGWGIVLQHGAARFMCIAIGELYCNRFRASLAGELCHNTRNCIVIEEQGLAAGGLCHDTVIV